MRRCLEIGLPLDEIRDAGDELIDRAVQWIHYGGRERLTVGEVAERAGVAVARVEQIARASGRAGERGSDDRLFEQEDVSTMSMIGLVMLLPPRKVRSGSVSRWVSLVAAATTCRA